MKKIITTGWDESSITRICPLTVRHGDEWSIEIQSHPAPAVIVKGRKPTLEEIVEAWGDGVTWMPSLLAVLFDLHAALPAAMTDAQALEIAGRVSTCVEAIREAEAFRFVPVTVASAVGLVPADREVFEAWIAKGGGDLSKFGTGVNTHYYNSAVNNAWTGWQARSRIGHQTAPAVPVGWHDAWETARQACRAGISEHRGFEIDAMVESTIIGRVLVAFEAMHVALSAAPKP